MINSIEEFARIWKKKTKELAQMDYFIFLLINELIQLLAKEYNKKSIPAAYRLNDEQISELVIQLADSLEFFYQQICFGNGCSLGCPNKLDIPFSKREDEVRLEIINQEFNGDFEACTSRKDCLRHDLVDYVVKDIIMDYYTFFMHTKNTDDDAVINDMTNVIVNFIIGYTVKNGGSLLKEPLRLMEMKS